MQMEIILFDIFRLILRPQAGRENPVPEAEHPPPCPPTANAHPRCRCIFLPLASTSGADYLAGCLTAEACRCCRSHCRCNKTRTNGNYLLHAPILQCKKQTGMDIKRNIILFSCNCAKNKYFTKQNYCTAIFQSWCFSQTYIHTLFIPY